MSIPGDISKGEMACRIDKVSPPTGGRVHPSRPPIHPTPGDPLQRKGFQIQVGMDFLALPLACRLWFRDIPKAR